MVFAGARRALLAPGLFTPRSLPGLNLWLDASQIVGSDGDPVATWLDLSGKGNHATQATEAKRPTYKVGIVNGRPVVRPDQTDDSLLATLVVAQPFTVFLAARWTSASSPGYLLDGADGTHRLVFQQGGGGQFGMNAGVDLSTGVANNTNWHVFELVANGASSIAMVDGVGASGDAGSHAIAAIRLFAAFNETQPAKGDTTALIVCSGALDAGTRAKARRYLGQLIGITVA